MKVTLKRIRNVRKNTISIFIALILAAEIFIYLKKIKIIIFKYLLAWSVSEIFGSAFSRFDKKRFVDKSFRCLSSSSPQVFCKIESIKRKLKMKHEI